MIVPVILIVVLIVILFYKLWNSEPKGLKNIPGPNALPLVGNLFHIARLGDALKYLQTMRNKYGKVFKVTFLTTPTIFLTDPIDCEILCKDNVNINKTDDVHEMLCEWMGTGLGTSDGTFWKEQRKLIAPAFHFSILAKLFRVIDEQSDILIDNLCEKSRTQEQFDTTPYLEDFTLDVICKTGMGVNFHVQTSQNLHEYITSINRLKQIFEIRILRLFEAIPITFPYTKIGREQKRLLKSVDQFTTKIIDNRRKDWKNGKIESLQNVGDGDSEDKKKHLALIDILLQGRHSSGRMLTNQEIKFEISTFLFAAQETTSTAMGFLLFELSRHPKIQEACYEEQCHILGDDVKRNVTFNELNEMSYLDRVIKEILRLYPPIVFIGRKLSTDLQIKTKNIVIPKGIAVNMFIWGVHHDPQIYPNPDEFDPDRFLHENVVKRSPYAFIPFSAGPRNCIGQRFGMIEMKTCISKIIRNFRLLPAYDDSGNLFEIDVKMCMTLSSANGKPVRLVSRK